MKALRSLRFVHLAIGLILVLATWSPLSGSAWGYAPIDELVEEIDQLRQYGEIFEISTASNLIVSLGTIGNSIDTGDLPTAKELLNAFSEEVNALSGALMTNAAAEEIVAKVSSIENGL